MAFSTSDLINASISFVLLIPPPIRNGHSIPHVAIFSSKLKTIGDFGEKGVNI